MRFWKDRYWYSIVHLCFMFFPDHTLSLHLFLLQLVEESDSEMEMSDIE